LQTWQNPNLAFIIITKREAANLQQLVGFMDIALVRSANPQIEKLRENLKRL